MKFRQGVTYYPYINPRQEFAENFAKMRKVGISVVRTMEIFPGWEYLEPEEGIYKFETLGFFVKEASKKNINFLMGLGVDNPPFWLYDKYSDVRFIDKDGHSVHRRVHSACHDHPGYRKEMEKFILKFVEHYANESSIIGWQFANEVRYGTRCVCKHTTIRFRDWLKEKYENIKTLNKSWGTTYQKWSQIQAYSSPIGPATYGIQAMWLDYKTFLSWSTAEFIGWGRDLIKKMSDKPVVHNNYGISGDGSLDHWLVAEKVDIVGIDMYTPLSSDPRVRNGWGLDMARSSAAGKEFWITEAAAGQYGTYIRTDADLDILKLNTLEQIGAGAKMIIYVFWKPSPCEQPHKYSGTQALLRADGSATKFLEIPKMVKELMEKNEELFINSEPLKPQAAIFYPEESIYLGEEAGFKDLTLRSFKGIYKAFLDAQIPVDFIRSRDIKENKIKRYKLIFFPLTLVLPQALGEKLIQWVEEGGYLISEARLGYVNEEALLYPKVPGAGLDRLFAAREEYYYQAEKASAQMSLTGDDFNLILPEVKEILAPQGTGEAIGYYDNGEVFAVRNSFGKGKTLFLGGVPSLSNYPVSHRVWESMVYVSEDSFRIKNVEKDDTKQREELKRLIKVISQEAGIKIPLNISTTEKDITVRWLKVKDGQYLTFILNYSTREALINITDSGQELSLISGEPFQKVKDEYKIELSPRAFSLILTRRTK